MILSPYRSSLLLAFLAIPATSCAQASLDEHPYAISYMEDQSRIFGVDPGNGTGPTPIMDGAGISGFHAWSPDGRFIAFTSDREGTPRIYLMDANSEHIARRRHLDDV